MHQTLLVCIVFALAVVQAVQIQFYTLSKVDMNVTELIREQGYPCEQHDVVTSDGFILSVQRIPHGRKNNPTTKKVVFLQHGLLDASSTWVNNFPDQSLAFLLADHGYDVWMGNVRGNRYSMGHKFLHPSDKRFWEWSLDEMAAIDLPTMLTYALNVTGRQTLNYVGHSQGTVIGLACFTSDVCNIDGVGNIASKVETFFALAPAPFVGHVRSPFFHFLAKTHLEKVFEFFGIHNFAPSTPLLRSLFPYICKNTFLAKEVCMNVICIITGCDTLRDNVNMTRVPVYVDGLPAGTSVQNIAHWSQAVVSDHFQKYDYGSSTKNFEHYGQSEPPSYNVTNLKTDLCVYYGGMDNLGDADDINEWLPKLPRVHLRSVKYYPHYGHMDFVWGIRANRDIYEHIVDYLRD